MLLSSFFFPHCSALLGSVPGQVFDSPTLSSAALLPSSQGCLRVQAFSVYPTSCVTPFTTFMFWNPMVTIPITHRASFERLMIVPSIWPICTLVHPLQERCITLRFETTSFIFPLQISSHKMPSYLNSPSQTFVGAKSLHSGLSKSTLRDFVCGCRSSSKVSTV